MASLIAKKVNEAAGLFIKNFSQRNLDISLLKGDVEVKDIELNPDVFQELIGLPPSLRLKRATCSSVKVKLPSVLKITQKPVEVIVDKIDVVLAEPVELTALGTAFADWNNRKRLAKLKKHEGAEAKPKKPKKPGKRGFLENLIDGVTVIVNEVHMRVETLGPIKSESWNEFIPPAVRLDILGLRVYATDYQGHVVNLKKSRYKTNFGTEVTSFRTVSIDSISVALESAPLRNQTGPRDLTYIIREMPVLVKMATHTRKIGNVVLGILVDVILEHVNVQVSLETMRHVLAVVNGLVSAMDRQLAPDEEKLASQKLLVYTAYRMLGLDDSVPAVSIKNRRYVAKTYKQCAIGSEMIDWLVQHQGLTRPAALALGRQMMDIFLLYHVTLEQPFLDGHFYYRFDTPAVIALMDKVGLSKVTAKSDTAGPAPSPAAPQRQVSTPTSASATPRTPDAVKVTNPLQAARTASTTTTTANPLHKTSSFGSAEVSDTASDSDVETDHMDHIVSGMNWSGLGEDFYKQSRMRSKLLRGLSEHDQDLSFNEFMAPSRDIAPPKTNIRLTVRKCNVDLLENDSQTATIALTIEGVQASICPPMEPAPLKGDEAPLSPAETVSRALAETDVGLRIASFSLRDCSASHEFANIIKSGGRGTDAQTSMLNARLILRKPRAPVPFPYHAVTAVVQLNKLELVYDRAIANRIISFIASVLRDRRITAEKVSEHNLNHPSSRGSSFGARPAIETSPGKRVAAAPPPTSAEENPMDQLVDHKIHVEVEVNGISLAIPPSIGLDGIASGAEVLEVSFDRFFAISAPAGYQPTRPSSVRTDSFPGAITDYAAPRNAASITRCAVFEVVLDKLQMGLSPSLGIRPHRLLHPLTVGISAYLRPQAVTPNIEVAVDVSDISLTIAPDQVMWLTTTLVKRIAPEPAAESLSEIEKVKIEAAKQEELAPKKPATTEPPMTALAVVRLSALRVSLLAGGSRELMTLLEFGQINAAIEKPPIGMLIKAVVDSLYLTHNLVDGRQVSILETMRSDTQQTPLLQLRLEMQSGLVKDVVVTGLSTDEAAEKLSAALVDSVIRHGILTAKSGSPVEGDGKMFMRLTGLHVTALPQPFIDLKNFFVLPEMEPVEMGGSDLDIDMSVSNILISVLGDKEPVLDASIGEAHIVRRGMLTTNEAIMIQVGALSYAAAHSQCTPISLTAKLQRTIDGGIPSIGFKLESGIAASMSPLELRSILDFVDKLKAGLGLEDAKPPTAAMSAAASAGVLPEPTTPAPSPRDVDAVLRRRILSVDDRILSSTDMAVRRRMRAVEEQLRAAQALVMQSADRMREQDALIGRLRHDSTRLQTELSASQSHVQVLEETIAAMARQVEDANLLIVDLEADKQTW
eukprot:TRINITY_DN10174_c0_g1_i1.p1 TRINITY_DN10174_c0_g1~~TRINITY_DN10174_c0_g1_i1.p1  ORF type:complete len:1378 (-),score=349.79 TRINITY_DN10174_c0_g1_i1:71-4204(-)